MLPSPGAPPWDGYGSPRSAAIEPGAQERDGTELGSRRDFFDIAAGAGATLVLTPELLRALQQSGHTLIQRTVPSSGEMLPVIPGVARQDGAALPGWAGAGSRARDVLVEQCVDASLYR
jgi:hypothetical protein